MAEPVVDQDPAFQLLRQEQIETFNQQKNSLDLSGLSGKDYRSTDLRKLNAEGLDFTNAYFRNADLRGIDFRQTKLEGCSFVNAKVSGCYFPASLTADEINMSIERGTRVRC